MYNYKEYDTVIETVKKIRLEIDQSPFFNENLVEDENIYYNVMINPFEIFQLPTPKQKDGVAFSPTTKFSTNDIIKRIATASAMIVGKVKGQHVPLLIKKVDAPFEDLIGLERLLFSRVFVNGKRAIYRRMDVIRKLHKERNPINPDYPVFTFEDGRMITYPEGLPAEAYIVTNPSDSLSFYDNLLFDVRLTKAVVLYVVGSIAMTLELHDIAEYYFNTVELELQGVSVDTMNTTIVEKEVDSEKF